MREVVEFLPYVNNITVLRQLIQDDLLNNNSKIYGAIVVQLKTNKRYYIKGEKIIKILEDRYEK
jgi:hypothetical protein